MPRTLSEMTLKILKAYHEGKTQSIIQNDFKVTQQAVSAAIKRHYDKVLTGQITFETTQHNKQHNTINNTTQLKEENDLDWGTTPQDDLIIDEMEKEFDLKTTQHNKQHNTINNTTQSFQALMEILPDPVTIQDFDINLELERIAKSSEFARLLISCIEGTTKNARGTNAQIKRRLKYDLKKCREVLN